MSKIDIGKMLTAGGAVVEALQKAADDNKVSLAPKDVPKVAQAVEAAIQKDVKEVQKEINSQITQATNQEPWYQSRVTVAQYVTLIATLLGLIGYGITPEYRDQIVAAVLAIGALVNPAYTLWARWFPKKPLGH